MWPFTKWGSKKTQQKNGNSLFVGTGVGTQSPSRDQQALSEEGYKKNAIGYRAVSLVAKGVASVPWTAYIGDDEVEGHDIAGLLNTRANRLESGSAVQESIASFYLLTGNSYPRVIRTGVNDDGPPKELYSLRPDRVAIKPDDTGLVLGYEYTVGSKKHLFTVEMLPDGTVKTEVWHFKTFNPLGDWYGMSPFEPAAYSVDQHNAGSKYNYHLLKNHARPSGVFRHKPNEYSSTLSEPQYESLKKDIDDNWVGEMNTGKPHLLEGGLEWQEVSWNPRDVDWSNGRNIAGREIAGVVGVAPMLAGIMGDATFANYAEANKSLWESTINCILSLMRDGYNAWLAPMYGQEGLRVDYDLDQVPAIAEARREVWAKLEQVSFLTTNEKRDAVGYEPVDGGDQILVSGLMIPLGEEFDDATNDAEKMSISDAARLGYGR